MKFDTLHGLLEQTEKNANLQGYEIEIPLVFGGISYGENKTIHAAITKSKKYLRKKNPPCWNIVVTRFDNGLYELVDYAK